ncbi:glutamate racemase [Pelotomaculum schinkii]|nr:glutamate racemase [Pelotomaculum schinkii]
MNCTGPIGFFDSGVGGLSVMKEVRRLLPGEDMIYYADSIYCPYGGKPPVIIRDRVFTICDFLISKGVKLIVMACNTASITALDAVRERITVPVVGLEPAVKPAVAATKNGKIGVLATGVTLAGERFHSLVERFGETVEVYTQPCPGLVELVEAGKLESPETRTLLARYLDPLLARGVDTIVLGCTHYPFLKPLVQKMSHSGVSVIDSGAAVARQVARLLQGCNLAADISASGREHFFTSGEQEEVQRVVRLLWGDRKLVVEQVRL